MTMNSIRYYIERYWPIVLAIVITLLFYQKLKSFNNIETVIGKFMDSSLSICGTMLGFLLTILTIINAIDTRRMRFVKESGNYDTLMHYLKLGLFMDFISITICFVAPAIFSITGLIQDKCYVYSIIVLIVVFTWLTNIRFAYIFVKLMAESEKK